MPLNIEKEIKDLGETLQKDLKNIAFLKDWQFQIKPASMIYFSGNTVLIHFSNHKELIDFLRGLHLHKWTKKFDSLWDATCYKAEGLGRTFNVYLSGGPPPGCKLVKRKKLVPAKPEHEEEETVLLCGDAAK